MRTQIQHFNGLYRTYFSVFGILLLLMSKQVAFDYFCVCFVCFRCKLDIKINGTKYFEL